jgi:hypothetical protein
MIGIPPPSLPKGARRAIFGALTMCPVLAILAWVTVGRGGGAAAQDSPSEKGTRRGRNEAVDAPSTKHDKRQQKKSGGGQLQTVGAHCNLHVTARRDAVDRLAIDVYLANTCDKDIEAPRWVKYIGFHETTLLLSLWVRQDDADVLLRSPSVPYGRLPFWLGILDSPIFADGLHNEPFVIKAGKRFHIRKYHVPVKPQHGYHIWCTLCLPLIRNEEGGETAILMRSNVDSVAPATDRKETAEEGEGSVLRSSSPCSGRTKI